MPGRYALVLTAAYGRIRSHVLDVRTMRTACGHDVNADECHVIPDPRHTRLTCERCATFFKDRRQDTPRPQSRSLPPAPRGKPDKPGNGQNGHP